ncbi:hypothetical protein GCM10009347_32900 [Shewanella algicola]|uniref:GGDEF domain-containing protein n=1 Tax=Shewanella algicola TaxID=640633 RepID=A0A9X1ZHL4_9GAMM|nr:hypothetical protein [Shewanella algicola]MCL1107038.1 hypothetical protein [Shewanella algicola]GGP64451.1 hypothetical protein GCM10009347_32900 [Shewanella algicola]
MTRSRNTSDNKLSRMFGFILGLLIVSLASPATAQVTQSFLTAQDVVSNTQQLSVNEQLDVIHDINTQRSEQAKILIEGLEQQSLVQPLSDVQTLRLRLLRCFNLLEFGHFEQAITLSTQGEQTARELKYDAARPYFMQCGATAYQSIGNTLQEQLLTEEALRLAKRYSEKQAIIGSLYLRSRQNTSLENYNQSIEDLRIGLDIYDEAKQQFQPWYLLPKSYVQLEISNVFFSMGDVTEALHFAELAVSDPSTFGSLNFALSINLARINIEIGDKEAVKRHLKQAEAENNRMTAERDLAVGSALLAAINLFIDNYDLAQQQALHSIELFTKYQEPIYVMRIKRTLAKVYIAQQKDNQALTLLNEIIEQATELKQYSDLEEFNQIVSEYYADKQQFESAYHYQIQRFNAAKQANNKLNNAHFMQYKAKLSAQNEPSIDEKPTTNNINQSLSIAALIILFLSVGLVLFLRRKPLYTNDESKEQSQSQIISAMLNNAKQGHYQLSMLLININHIRQVDVPNLLRQLQLTLREQDQLFRHNLDELIIILPHTSAIGATRVVHQIETVLNLWPTDVKTSIGIASLQQLDTFEGLMKKAVLNQLNKMKPQDNPLS